MDEKRFNENKTYLFVMRGTEAIQICCLSEISIAVNKDSLLWSNQCRLGYKAIYHHKYCTRKGTSFSTKLNRKITGIEA